MQKFAGNLIGHNVELRSVYFCNAEFRNCKIRKKYAIERISVLLEISTVVYAQNKDSLPNVR